MDRNPFEKIVEWVGRWNDWKECQRLCCKCDGSHVDCEDNGGDERNQSKIDYYQHHDYYWDGDEKFDDHKKTKRLALEDDNNNHLLLDFNYGKEKDDIKNDNESWISIPKNHDDGNGNDQEN